jgi:hypothetical protein
MSKDNFSSLLKMVSLDDNTKSLIGSSKEEIAKSLRSNINENNSALYNVLIAKAEEPTEEEEEAFRTALGQDTKDEDVSEVDIADEEEGEAPTTKTDYRGFLNLHRRMTLLENNLSLLEKLSEELELVGKTTDTAFPSGYKFENDEEYDKIRNINASNFIISVLVSLSKDKKYLENMSNYIKNGILVPIAPPLKESRTTGEMVAGKRKEPVDVRSIQERLIAIMDKPISDMSFTEALSNLHINRFKKNPLVKRGKEGKGRYSKDISFAREFVRGTTIGSRQRDIQNKLRRLRKILQNFRDLQEYEESLLEKISEIKDLGKNIDVEEAVTKKIQDMNRLISSGKQGQDTKDEEEDEEEDGEGDEASTPKTYREQVAETFSKYKETLADVRKNPDKYIKEIREKYELQLYDAQIDLRAVVDEMKKISPFSEEIVELIDYTKKYMKLDIIEDRELEKSKNRLKDAKELLEDVKANPNKFGENREQQLIKKVKSLEEEIEKYEQNKEKYSKLRALINKNSKIIFDLNDKFDSVEKIVNKVEESSDKDAENLAGRISEYVIFRGMTGNFAKDLEKVVSLKEEESEMLLSEATDIVEDLKRISDINTKIGELL